MATLKFQDPSPYIQKPPLPSPPTDINVASFLQGVSPEFSTNEEIVPIALFGAGRAGLIHLIGLVHNPRVELLYIVEDLVDKWDKLKDCFHLENTQFLTSKDRDTVFNDCRVKAVVVASPTKTHEDIVVNALASGKNVFCEKPVAKDIESTIRCFKQAKEAGKVLFCGFNRRFDPAFRHIKNRVRSGEVGHVHTIKTCSRDSQLPSINYLRSSNGIFHDTAAHNIDLICWMLGEYPNRVTAQGSALVPEIANIGDYDTVVITLKFPSGTLATIDVSRLSSHGYDQRVEVFGPRGMLICGNERPMPGIESYNSRDGATFVPIFNSFSSRYKISYQQEMEHFLDVVIGEAIPEILGHEIVAVSKIAEACQVSARTNTFVDLEWGPMDFPPV